MSEWFIRDMSLNTKGQVYTLKDHLDYGRFLSVLDRMEVYKEKVKELYSSKTTMTTVKPLTYIHIDPLPWIPIRDTFQSRKSLNDLIWSSYMTDTEKKKEYIDKIKELL